MKQTGETHCWIMRRKGRKASGGGDDEMKRREGGQTLCRTVDAEELKIKNRTQRIKYAGILVKVTTRLGCSFFFFFQFGILCKKRK